jgi:hypothetical protein
MWVMEVIMANRIPTLHEAFEWEGKWWVPSIPEIEPKTGVLKFQPGQLPILEIEFPEALTNEGKWSLDTFSKPSYPIIKGRTKIYQRFRIKYTSYICRLPISGRTNSKY